VDGFSGETFITCVHDNHHGTNRLLAFNLVNTQEELGRERLYTSCRALPDGGLSCDEDSGQSHPYLSTSDGGVVLESGDGPATYHPEGDNWYTDVTFHNVMYMKALNGDVVWQNEPIASADNLFGGQHEAWAQHMCVDAHAASLVGDGGGSTAHPVTGVTLVPSQLSLATGAHTHLLAQVSPADSQSPAVTWTVTPEGVVEVDAGGVVTALSAGTAVVTATAADGSKATADVTVSAQGATTQAVTLSGCPAAALGTDADPVQLTAHPTPADPDATFRWVTSDAAVASVDAQGLVTVAGEGKASITASVDGSPAKDSCSLEIDRPESLPKSGYVYAKRSGYINLIQQIAVDSTDWSSRYFTPTDEDGFVHRADGFLMPPKAGASGATVYSAFFQTTSERAVWVECANPDLTACTTRFVGASVDWATPPADPTGQGEGSRIHLGSLGLDVRRVGAGWLTSTGLKVERICLQSDSSCTGVDVDFLGDVEPADFILETDTPEDGL